MSKLDSEQLLALNNALQIVDTIEPIIDISDTGSDIDQEMRQGLAKAYAIAGFRKYLAYLHNRALKSTAMRSVTLVDQAAGKARALTSKEILVRGKQAFEEYDTVRNLIGPGKSKRKRIPKV